MKVFPPFEFTAPRRSHWTQFNYNRQPKSSVPREKVCTPRFDISSAAKLENIITNLRTEGNIELRTFGQMLHKTIQSETFNAAKMAEKAPKRLKSWAEKNGTNLEEMLNQWASKSAEIKKKFSILPYSFAEIGGPGPCCHHYSLSRDEQFRNNISDIDTENRPDLQSFHQQVLEAIQSESFDATEMAEKAPAGLKTWTEENGIDLEEMLSQWATKAAEIKEKFTIASSSWNETWLVDSLLGQIMMNYLSDKFENVISDTVKEDQSELQSFHQQVLEAIQSESFDATEMAEKAPAGLKTWTEENGIDLEEMLSQWATKAAEIKEKLSTASYNWNESWLTHSLLGHIMLSYLNDKSETT